MKFLTWKNGKYLLVVLFLLAGFWYFLQTEEKYLERKTLYLISLASVPAPVTPSAMQRINKAASFLRFDVNFEGTFRKKTFKAINLQEIKPFLGIYFKQTQTALWQAEELKVEIKKGAKTGRVFLTVQGEWNEKSIRCETRLHWLKEKKWLIHNIEALKCKEL